MEEDLFQEIKDCGWIEGKEIKDCGWIKGSDQYMSNNEQKVIHHSHIDDATPSLL